MKVFAHNCASPIPISLPNAELQCVDVNEEDKAAPSAEADHSQALESFRSLCGDADCNALKSLLERVSAGGDSDVSPVILSPDADKAHRSVSSLSGY